MEFCIAPTVVQLQPCHSCFQNLCRCRQAFEEFATLWLDQFDQETLPSDTVQVLCALTSSSKHVPSRVPKRVLAKRWRAKAEELLHHHNLISKSEISTWHFLADDLLNTTQRMSKLAAKDAVYLAPRLAMISLSMSVVFQHSKGDA